MKSLFPAPSFIFSFSLVFFLSPASEMEMKKRIIQELGNKNPAEVSTALLCFFQRRGPRTRTERRRAESPCVEVSPVSVPITRKTT